MSDEQIDSLSPETPPKKKKKEKKPPLHPIQTMKYLLAPVWRHGRAFLFITIIYSVFFSVFWAVYNVAYGALLIERAVRGDKLIDVIIFGAILAGITIAMVAINNLVRRLYITREKERMVLDIKRDIFMRGKQVDYKYIANPEFYDNYQFMIDERENKSNDARQWIIDTLAYGISVALLTTFMAIVGPFTLVIVAVSFIFSTLVEVHWAKLDVKLREAQIKPDRKLDYTRRIFYQHDYAADMRTTDLSGQIMKRYGEAGKEKLDIIQKFQKKYLFWGTISNLYSNIIEIVIIIYLIQSMVLGNTSNLGMYTAALNAYYQLNWRSTEFAMCIRRVAELSGYARRFKKYDDMISTIETQEGGLPPEEGKFALRLDNLCFKYENSQFGLKDLNIEVEKGQKIAIVGENGAGKSTLVKLLLRLYDPDSGAIMINGRDMREYNIHRLRERIGAAFQDSNVYALSLGDNIDLYGKGVSAVRPPFIDDLLEKNNATLDSEVTKEFDKNGIMLSGGERQKVALARIMTGDFGLLLLDEPSSALDPLAEYEMSRHLMNAANSATTIMVAHRLSTIRDADKIILIDNGEIKEVGDHDSLMRLGGIYYDMFTKQAEKYAAEASEAAML